MAKAATPKDSPAPAAASQPEAAKPIYTEEDMRKAVAFERYVAWHRMAVMRSQQFGDPQVWVDAANEVLNLLISPPKPEPVKEDLFEEQSGTETEADDEE